MTLPLFSPPEAGEFDPYYAAYVDQIEGDDILGVLEEQIGETVSLLANVEDSTARYRYEPGKWSVKEVLGHIMDTERVFAYRALCIARGERASLPGMDQDDYVRGANFDDRSIGGLLEEYQHIRRSTVSLFSSLDADSWRRAGVANGVEVSVRAIAFIIGGHQAHHMKVLNERYLV